jgi:hypothetical protein
VGFAGVAGLDGVVAGVGVTSGSPVAASSPPRPSRKRKAAKPTAASTPTKAKTRIGGLRVTLTVLLIGRGSRGLYQVKRNEKGAVSRAFLSLPTGSTAWTTRSCCCS